MKKKQSKIIQGYLDADARIQKLLDASAAAELGDLARVPFVAYIATMANAGALPTAAGLKWIDKGKADARAEVKKMEKQLRPAIKAALQAVKLPLSPEAAERNAADAQRAEDQLRAARAKCEEDVKDLEELAWPLRDIVPGEKNPKLHYKMKRELVRRLVHALLKEGKDPATMKKILKTYLADHFPSDDAIKQAVHTVTKAAGETFPQGRKKRKTTPRR